MRERKASLRSEGGVQISTAPAVAPAMTLRRADGFSFLLASTFSSSTGAILLEPLVCRCVFSTLSAANSMEERFPLMTVCEQATLRDDSVMSGA